MAHAGQAGEGEGWPARRGREERGAPARREAARRPLHQPRPAAAAPPRRARPPRRAAVARRPLAAGAAPAVARRGGRRPAPGREEARAVPGQRAGRRGSICSAPPRPALPRRVGPPRLGCCCCPAPLLAPVREGALAPAAGARADGRGADRGGPEQTEDGRSGGQGGKGGRTPPTGGASGARPKSDPGRTELLPARGGASWGRPAVARQPGWPRRLPWRRQSPGSCRSPRWWCPASAEALHHRIPPWRFRPAAPRQPPKVRPCAQLQHLGVRRHPAQADRGGLATWPQIRARRPQIRARLGSPAPDGAGAGKRRICTVARLGRGGSRGRGR